MIGTIAADGQTVTLTTGQLSPWVMNLTPTQRSLVQVFGYDQKNNQVVSKTLTPSGFGYGDLGYNGTTPQAIVAALQLDGGGYTMTSTTFKLTRSWLPSAGVRFYICAPMFDVTGLLQHAGETIVGPPFSSDQNPSYYNSDAYPPYYSPLVLTAYDRSNGTAVYQLINPYGGTQTIGNLNFHASNPYVDPRGHQVGSPIYGGGGLGSMSGYSIPTTGVIAASGTITASAGHQGATGTYFTNLGPTADPATIVVANGVPIKSGAGYTGATGGFIYNVYSHCLGAGYFGSDGGFYTPFGPMGIPQASVGPLTDSFYETYQGQARDRGNANAYTHIMFGVQYGNDIGSAEVHFYAGQKDAAAPQAVIPSGIETSVVLGNFMVAGTTVFMSVASHDINFAGYRTGIWAVTNIVGSALSTYSYTCTTVAGSLTVQVSNPTWGSQSHYGADPGGIIKYQQISGTGIPTQAYVAAINQSASTIQLDRPAIASGTTTCYFTIYALNTPDQWSWSEIPSPFPEGLQRGGGSGWFYSDPATTWTSNGTTYCGDGYYYSFAGTFDAYFPQMQQQFGYFYAYRVKYADLFNGGNPFLNGEWYLGPYAGNWTGTAAKSYVTFNSDGTTSAPETSGWVKQSIVQNDQNLLGVRPAVITGNPDGVSIVQKSDGTYVGVVKNGFRHTCIASAPSLLGPWTSWNDLLPDFNHGLNPAPVICYDPANYLNSDGPSNTEKVWSYGGFFRPEVTWNGQGVDDFCISDVATCKMNLYDPRKYWTRLWAVSGL